MRNDLKIGWELPRQNSEPAVPSRHQQLMKHIAGGTLGRPTQTSCCAHSCDLCMSIPTDVTDSSIGCGGIILVLVFLEKSVCPCSGILLTVPFWIVHYLITQPRGFCLQTQYSQIPQGHLELVNKNGHSFIPVRKKQKASKVPMGHCLFQSVLYQDQLGPGTPTKACS